MLTLVDGQLKRGKKLFVDFALIKIKIDDKCCELGRKMRQACKHMMCCTPLGANGLLIFLSYPILFPSWFVNYFIGNDSIL